MKKILLSLVVVVFCLFFVGTVQAKIHVVKKGEILIKIAKLYNCDFKKIKILQGKKGRIAELANPNFILPGQVLQIPENKTDPPKSKIFRNILADITSFTKLTEASAATLNEAPFASTKFMGDMIRSGQTKKPGYYSINLPGEKGFEKDKALSPGTNIILEKRVTIIIKGDPIPTRANISFQEERGLKGQAKKIAKNSRRFREFLTTASVVPYNVASGLENKLLPKNLPIRTPRLFPIIRLNSKQDLMARSDPSYPRRIKPILDFWGKTTLKEFMSETFIPSIDGGTKNILDDLKVGNFSGYTSRPEETDSSPFITADGTDLRIFRKPVIANNGLPFGTKIKVFYRKHGLKEIGEIFEVRDRMNTRYRGRHFDIYFGMDLAAAKKFGRKDLTYIILN